MMIPLSSLCKLYVIVISYTLFTQILIYLSFFYLAYDFISDAAFSWLVLSFVGVFISCLLNIALALFSIVLVVVKREAYWLVAMYIFFAILVCIILRLLGPPGTMTVYGIKNRLLSNYSVDQICQCGVDLKTELPNLIISKGEPSKMSDDDLIILKSLQIKYSFLKLADRPDILIYDNSVQIKWGSGVLGTWGVWIGHPNVSTFSCFEKVSDQVYFFSSFP